MEDYDAQVAILSKGYNFYCFFHGTMPIDRKDIGRKDKLVEKLKFLNFHINISLVHCKIQILCFTYLSSGLSCRREKLSDNRGDHLGGCVCR